jgi:hypothetical protein
MNIRPVGAKLIHADRQQDEANNRFLLFWNAQKKAFTVSGIDMCQ